MAKSQRQKRDEYLQRVYGITILDYEEILRRQGNGCAICGKSRDGRKSLAVDHNHKTNEIRGVLCSYCNHRLVGRHRDPELLRRIAKYLEQGTGWFVPVKKKKKRKRKSVRRN